MRPNKPNRRQFLIGAGGAALAIPFLPSLVSRGWAQNGAAPHKCFFALGTDHGGVWGANMYPVQGVLNQQISYAGRTVRYGNLPTAVGGDGKLALSEVCKASALTPALSRKFNILRGLDIPWRISHHAGGHLGNFAETTGGTIGGQDARAFQTSTIDQFMAWSPSFYSTEDLASRATQRSFCVGSGNMSWNFSSPSTRTGQVVRQPSHRQNLSLFNFFFDPGSAYNGVDVFIIDRVKQSYDRLKRHPRLSNADRMRLDQHVERMYEIERKLQVVKSLQPPAQPSVNSDSELNASSFDLNPASNAAYCHLMNDVIVAAFSTGICRVGSWFQSIKFADQRINDWHGQVAHGGLGAQVAQAWTVGWNQGTFEHVMVDLATKLDQVTMGDGSTLLDNSLLMFTQEAGQVTHHSSIVGYPVVTAGGAGGALRTGLYVDYGNKNTLYSDLAELQTSLPLVHSESPGLYYQQFLGTVLQAMGIATSEYEHFTDFRGGEATGGYGVHHVDPVRATDYVESKRVMGEKLPIISG